MPQKSSQSKTTSSAPPTILTMLFHSLEWLMSQVTTSVNHNYLVNQSSKPNLESREANRFGLTVPIHHQHHRRRPLLPIHQHFPRKGLASNTTFLPQITRNSTKLNETKLLLPGLSVLVWPRNVVCIWIQRNLLAGWLSVLLMEGRWYNASAKII